MPMPIRALVAVLALVAGAPAGARGQVAGATSAPLIPEIAEALSRAPVPTGQGPALADAPTLAAKAPPAEMASRSARVRIALERAPSGVRWSAWPRRDRLTVDLTGARAPASRETGEGLVRQVRVAPRGRDGVRITLDLAGPARLTGVTGGTMLELALTATSQADFAQLASLGAMAAPDAAVASAGAARPLRLIMLDPGHGGHDVGAISVFEGRFEKDLTLEVARAIAAELDASGRFRVAFTRRDDRFIPLAERVAMARRAGADLFLSIHGDSAPNPLARGATVYTLSTVASDAMAARVAARENKADALASVPLAGEEPQAAAILYDLALRHATNASAAFAQTLAASMAQRGPVTGNTHRFAGFRVLKTADMPAALLETGYLTNEEDARRLFSADGQRAIAQAVRAAIDAHFAPAQRLAAAR